LSKQVTIAERQEQVPPYHRFSLLAHALSVFAGVLVGYLLFTIAVGLSDRDTLADYIGKFLMIFIVAAIFSLPATWVCVRIARRFGWSGYWQFGLVGILGAFVTTNTMLLIVTGLQEKNYLSNLVTITAFLAPVGIISGLTYRKISGVKA
tara:strand:+ start:100620 stop:101069 length:450 start_codon:yes stop_codon:yes gene_type:complete